MNIRLQEQGFKLQEGPATEALNYHCRGFTIHSLVTLLMWIDSMLHPLRTYATPPLGNPLSLQGGPNRD